MLVAKRLASKPISFGTYGRIAAFEDTDWLDYSYYSTDDFRCYGHASDDQVLEGLPLLATMEAQADVDGDGVVSNIELYNAIDPTVYLLDYIYNDFKWTLRCRGTHFESGL